MKLPNSLKKRKKSPDYPITYSLDNYLLTMKLAKLPLNPKEVKDFKYPSWFKKKVKKLKRKVTKASKPKRTQANITKDTLENRVQVTG